MKYWIMRMPEPIPLGLTFLLPKERAMEAASLVNTWRGGKVETLVTVCTQRFLPGSFLPLDFMKRPVLLGSILESRDSRVLGAMGATKNHSSLLHAVANHPAA